MCSVFLKYRNEFLNSEWCRRDIPKQLRQCRSYTMHKHVVARGRHIHFGGHDAPCVDAAYLPQYRLSLHSWYGLFCTRMSANYQIFILWQKLRQKISLVTHDSSSWFNGHFFWTENRRHSDKQRFY